MSVPGVIAGPDIVTQVDPKVVEQPVPLCPTRLAFALAAALVASGVISALVVVVAGRSDWWKAHWGALAVSAVAAASSAPVLLWGARHGLMRTVVAYFATMGLRLLVSLAGAVLVIWALRSPAAPTLLLTVGFYWVVLAAEVAVLARALNRKQAVHG